MLIVFKNGKELRVSKEVVSGIIDSINNHPTAQNVWHKGVDTKGELILIINASEISFIVDEEKMKDVL